MRIIPMTMILLLLTACANKTKQNINSEFILIRSSYAEGEVTSLCASHINDSKKALDEISNLNQTDRNIDNTLLKFETTMADFTDNINPLTFMAYVSNDEKISNEASQCEIEVGKFAVEVMTRRDLYDAIKYSNPRTPQESRLLKQTLEDFEKNGLKLSDRKLNQVQELKKKLTTLESQYSMSLNKDDSNVIVDPKDVEGLPTNYLANLKKTQTGEFIIPTTESDYPIVMQNCKNAKTRQKMFIAYFNRGGQKNMDLLSEAIQIRHQIAKLLGFKNWADLKVQKRMAKNSKTVLRFLNGLKDKLSERNKKDFGKLLAYKRNFEPTANSLDQWDVTFYNYQLKKKEYNLDNEKIREFFPADTVIKGMFEVFSEMLGVNFQQITNTAAWDKSVKLYSIHDNKSGYLIGYFFTDFYPRKGKYDHAAAFSLISGRLKNEKYNPPVSSIVANITPGMNDKPPLLDHKDVATIFHEFGHIMHQTLTQAPFASLSGSAVAQDFVEAPSQMLENWVWSQDILNKISGHHADESQKLPKPILEKMIEARDFNQSISYTRQLLYSLFDMTLHAENQKQDPNKIYSSLYKKIIGQEPAKDQKFPASFGHLMGGYDAGYYSYLWSEVYAQDMFEQFSKTDLSNPKIGIRYRREILETGNMQDADILLKKFLGREPNSDAFFKKLGI